MVSEGNRRIDSSQRSGQSVFIDRYTEHLAQANIDASIGSIGDSYDNAMVETINDLYKTEAIRHYSVLGVVSKK